MDKTTHLKKGEMYLKLNEHGQIVPCDGESAERYLKLKRDRAYKVSVKEARNYEFLKKYFSLLKLCFDNQDEYTDFDWFRRHTLIKVGWCTTEVDPRTGNVIVESKSISFDGCSAKVFEEIYNKTVDLMIVQYCYDDNFFNRLRSY